jgi:D-glycero-beta-D-manno-heptose 1-phosphate adenylyltransferase
VKSSFRVKNLSFERSLALNLVILDPCARNQHYLRAKLIRHSDIDEDILHPAVFSLEQLILRFAREKRNGRKVVFTNGCFDLLHPGHIRTFEAARSLGDILIVGVNGDESVRTLKGPTRPVVPEQERAEILASLECVDAVTIFSDLIPQKVIAALLPDVLVKGGDWPDDQIVGRAEVESSGGRVARIAIVPGYSTTEILRRIHSIPR